MAVAAMAAGKMVVVVVLAEVAGWVWVVEKAILRRAVAAGGKA